MAIGAPFDALLGGSYVDKVGRLRIFLLDLFFFVVSEIGAAREMEPHRIGGGDRLTRRHGMTLFEKFLRFIRIRPANATLSQ